MAPPGTAPLSSKRPNHPRRSRLRWCLGPGIRLHDPAGQYPHRLSVRRSHVPGSRRGKETSKGEFVIPVQTGIQNPVSSRASGLPIGSGVDNPDAATISRLKYQPHIRIVAHYRWTGVRHTDLYPQLVDLLKNVWHCRRIVVDATGIGQPVASFLRQSIGHAVVPFTFTAPAKSTLGFNLLAAINSGHLKMYAGDGSASRALLTAI
jgi:hypothetical protein